MVVKFLELDSNYRDRNAYPNPADFQVNISQTGMRNNTNALDPVTLGYPVVTFCPSDIPAGGLTFHYDGYAAGGVGTLTDSSSDTTFLINIANVETNLFLDSGYFVGLMLELVGTGAPQNGDADPQPAKPQPGRRIISWTFINDIAGNLYFLVTIDKPFEYDLYNNSPSTGLSCDFVIYNPSDFTGPNCFIFLPYTSSIPNYYNNYIIYNQTQNQYATITSFDMNSHLAAFNLPGTFTWLSSDTYILRKENYRVSSTVLLGATTSSIQIAGVTGDSSYINNYIAVYENTSAFNRNPLIAKIVGVDNGTPTAPIVPTKFLTTLFLSAPTAAKTVEILGFNFDNVSPFVYTGTMSAQSQPSAQEVTLNSLTLPNVTLQNGGRIAYYPYVYVEVENVSSSSSGTRNLIYSNNPNTYKAVFKVPITDLNHPNQSPFVKLTGNGMKQTMVFKQNDDMRVSIRLPSGDLFQSASSDTSNGQAPNPLLQISLLFGMEKL